MGEGVRTVTVNPGDNLGSGASQTAAANNDALVNAAIGIVKSQTFIDDDPTKNVSSITIKTTNTFGVFTNGTFIQFEFKNNDSRAYKFFSNTFKYFKNNFRGIVGRVVGSVSNVVPVLGVLDT